MTKYTDAEKAKVIEGALQSIATGQSLLSFCKNNEIPYRTVYDWLTEDESANSLYARAKEAGTHYLAQECLEIADDATNDWMVANSSDDDSSGWRLNGEHVQRSKLRIDTRLRLIGKWNRKDYGEKVEQEHKGELGVTLNVTRKIVKDAD